MLFEDMFRMMMIYDDTPTFEYSIGTNDLHRCKFGSNLGIQGLHKNCFDPSEHVSISFIDVQITSNWGAF